MTIDRQATATHHALRSRPADMSVAAILLLALAVVAGANLLDVLNPNYFHEEQRILYPLDPARTNAKDYVGTFLSAFPQPLLYGLATDLFVSAGGDLVLFHKGIMVLCWIAMFTASGLAGWHLGGPVGAVAVPLLIAAQPNYAYQINAAVPHAFAFPLLAFALVFLLYDRPYWLAGLILLSGLLYPPVSPILGACLAWQLLIDRQCWRSANPNRIADLSVLTITGVIAVLLLLRQVAPLEGYGAALPPGAKADLYPENGPDGRYFYAVFHPLAYVARLSIWQFRQVVPPPVVLFLMAAYIAGAAFGVYWLHQQNGRFRAVLSFIVPAAIICVAVVILRPYLAYRFVLYPLFVILPVLFVGGLTGFVKAYGSRQVDRAAATVAVLAIYLVCLNSFNTERNGFAHRLDPPSNRLMDVVATLPADSLLAAWPGEHQSSLIPYRAGRPLLVTHKAHYPAYEDYALAMRARMNDLIDAYLATDLASLARLRCRWQVDFLIVDRNHFDENKDPPTYFAPFGARIESILRTVDRQNMILRRPPEDAIVFEAGSYLLVDLARLTDGAACAATK